MRILFLGANGLDTSKLEIAKEAAEVRRAIDEMSSGQIEHKEKLSVQPGELGQLLLSFKPHVVHFSGHGIRIAGEAPRSDAKKTREFGEDEDEKAPPSAADSALLFEGEDGKGLAIASEALETLFEIMQSQRLVVLNACFSAAQAKRIAKHVDCVIGMKRAIPDKSAIAFSIGFYQALVGGKNVWESFRLGKNMIRICGLKGEDLPALHMREGLNATQMRLVDGALKVLPLPARERWKTRAKQAGWVMGALVLLGFLREVVPLPWPAIEPKSATVVVVGPRGFASDGAKAAEMLCADLDKAKKGTEPKVICRTRARFEDLRRIREKALRAGASVLVVVDDEKRAQVYPLGDLAEHHLIAEKLPYIDLGESGVGEKAAPVLRELARVADGGTQPEFMKNRLGCWGSVAKEQLGLAVMTLVVRNHVPDCGIERADIKPLLEICTSGYCEIVRELDAALRPRGVSCTGDDTDRMGWVRKRDASGIVYERMAASSAAVCLLVRDNQLSREERSELERIARRPEPECEPLKCGGSAECQACSSYIGERAGFWAEGKLWQRAEAEYRTAFAVRNDHETALGVVGAMLHRWKDFPRGALQSQVEKEFMGTEDAAAEQKVRMALFRWIAAKRDGSGVHIEAAEAALLKAYAAIEQEKTVYKRESPDIAEKTLLCEASAKECVVYELLDTPKGAETGQRLREALRVVVLPEEAR